jgi:hypothetical protein
MKHDQFKFYCQNKNYLKMKFAPVIVLTFLIVFVSANSGRKRLSSQSFTMGNREGQGNFMERFMSCMQERMGQQQEQQQEGGSEGEQQQQQQGGVGEQQQQQQLG